MGETKVIYASGGCCTFAVALSALVIACLSFVRVNELRELSTTTTTLSSATTTSLINNSGGPSPTELHGLWQVCGQVNVLMVTGEQNDAFDELDIVNLSAYLTYVFRPSTRTPPNNEYLFEGDRCGFTRHASTGLDEPPISYFGADSPTIGSLSPDGSQATFFQYFNSTATVSPKTQPNQVYVQHIRRFLSKDIASISFFAWYPSNDEFNADTAIWGYQSTATYKKVSDIQTCDALADYVTDNSDDLPSLDLNCNVQV